jgi:hypothetical protein
MCFVSFMLVSRGPLSLPDKSQVSEIFVNDLALDSIIDGRSKWHSKFKHERICSAEKVV